MIVRVVHQSLLDQIRLEGFPIGGVAAFDPKEGGVISPGGVGFDINCGVRLLSVRGIRPKKAREHRGEVAKALAKAVPAGAGRGGKILLKAHELDQVGKQGAAWAVERGFGKEEDLERIEEKGTAAWAEPRFVSADARIRGPGGTEDPEGAADDEDEEDHFGRRLEPPRYRGQDDERAGPFTSYALISHAFG